MRTAKELYDCIVSNKVISSNEKIILFDDIEEADMVSYMNPDTMCIVLGSPIGLLIDYEARKDDELHHDLLEIIRSKDYLYTFIVANVPKLHEKQDLIHKYNMVISENMMFFNDPLKHNQIHYLFDATDENIFDQLFGEIKHYLQINN